MTVDMEASKNSSITGPGGISIPGRLALSPVVFVSLIVQLALSFFIGDSLIEIL